MRDILHEAILFDMYYGGKSPGEDGDVKDEAMIPVTEATPAFRDFYVDNVVCNGAEKALMIRGLPEMSIKGIHIENSTFQTGKGVDIIEAQNISLKNIRLNSKDTSPLINIKNGNGIVFNQIVYDQAQLLFKISGKKSAQIKVLNTDESKAKAKVEFEQGINTSVLTTAK